MRKRIYGVVLLMFFCFCGVADVCYIILGREDWLTLAIVGGISIAISYFIGYAMHEKRDELGMHIVAIVILYLLYMIILAFIMGIILQKMNIGIFITSIITFCVGYFLGVLSKSITILIK